MAEELFLKDGTPYTPPVNEDAGNWRSGFDEAIRNDPSLSKFDDVDNRVAMNKMAHSHLEAQKLIGKDKLVMLTDSSTPDQVKEFYTKLGRPITSDKYTTPADVKMDENLSSIFTPEKIAEYKKLAYELGITQKQFDGWWKNEVNAANALYKLSEEQETKENADADLALRTEWQDTYPQKVDLAKKVLSQYGSDEIKDKYGNDPDIIKMFAKIGKMFSEDQLLGKGPTSAQTPEQIQAEINELRKPGSAYFNELDPTHKQVVERVTELYKKLGGVQK